MKKLYNLGLSLLLGFGLTACAGNPQKQRKKQQRPWSSGPGAPA